MAPSAATPLARLNTSTVGDALSRSSVRVVTVDDAWILSSTMAADQTVGVPTCSTTTPAATPPVTVAVVSPTVTSAAVSTALATAVGTPGVAGAAVTPMAAATAVAPAVAAATVTPAVAAAAVKPAGATAAVTPAVAAAAVAPAIAAAAITPAVAAAVITPAVAAADVTPAVAVVVTTGTGATTFPTAANTTISSDAPAVNQTATPTVPLASTSAATPAVAASAVEGAGTNTSEVGATATPPKTTAVPQTAAAAALAAAVASVGGAAARARARASTSGMTPEARRVGRYLSAILGARASDKTVSDTAALIGLAGRIEDNNSGLRFIVHASGVSRAGDLGWASLYGEEGYVDPDVLRVFGQAHAFVRGREVLTRSGLPDGTPMPRLVGTNHRDGVRPAPIALPPPVPSAEDEEYLNTMTSPVDQFLPPSVGIQRLARQVARARSASQSSAEMDDERPLKEGTGRASASGNASDASATASASAMEGASMDQRGFTAAGGPIDGSAISLAAGGLLPFVLETVRPPPPHHPSKSSIGFITDLFLNRRAPVQLLRATLKAVIIFFAMRFGLSTRLIQEGFSRWWPHQLVLTQEATGAVVGTRWPLGVNVPLRFLPKKYEKQSKKAGGGKGNRAGGKGKNGGNTTQKEGGTRDDATVLDTGKDDTEEDSFVITLDAIPTSEMHCKNEIALAALLLLWDKEPRARRIMEHEVFKADHAAQRRMAVAKRSAAAAALEADPEADATAAAGLVLAAVDEVAAAQGAAVGSKGTAQALAPRPAPFVGADSAATRAAARAAAVGGSSSAAPSPPKRSRGNTVGGGRGAPPLSPSATTAVKDGPCDMLDASGFRVALGVADLGRRVLHNHEVPPHLVVVRVLEVMRDGEVYPFEADFPIETPFVAVRLMRDTAGCFIVWRRDALRPL